MNNDLIRRSDLKAAVDDICYSWGEETEVEGYVLIKLVEKLPAIDAVEVVRCKDCVKRDQSFRCIALYYGFNPHDDWFCAEGERDNAEVHDETATDKK